MAPEIHLPHTVLPFPPRPHWEIPKGEAKRVKTHLRAVTAIRQATRCKATANHDEADSLLAWTQELLAVP